MGSWACTATITASSSSVSGRLLLSAAQPSATVPANEAVRLRILWWIGSLCERFGQNVPYLNRWAEAGFLFSTKTVKHFPLDYVWLRVWFDRSLRRCVVILTSVKAWRSCVLGVFAVLFYSILSASLGCGTQPLCVDPNHLDLLYIVLSWDISTTNHFILFLNNGTINYLVGNPLDAFSLAWL